MIPWNRKKNQVLVLAARLTSRNHVISNMCSGGIAVLENRKWAEVGMVVGDDVAVDAINELYI